MRAHAPWRILVQVLLAAASCGKVDPMIRVVPDSRSLVLRATHITHLSIEGVTAPEWGAEPVRTAHLSLLLHQVFKGELRATGARVALSVPQNRPQTRGDILPPQGCWPDQSLLPGDQFLAFSIAQETDPAAVLAEGACQSLMPAGVSLIDVSVAAKIESEGLALDAIARMVKPDASKLHELFIEYLGERFRDLELERRGSFEAVMDFLETPDLPPVPRLALLNAVRRQIDSSQIVTPYHFHRLAVAMFRLLALPEAQPLHENLVGTYLPDTLNLVEGGEKRPAGTVFREWPQDRAAARRALAGYRPSAAAAPLLKWIDESR